MVVDRIQYQPTVSVVMITYGQEAFIKQAVEGVLMQECDFQIELIVADDCSPDATSQVMKGIIKTHPRASWIKYTRHPKNIGIMPNFVWALEQAKGKYIALCEGDDYWTDPSKLQKQVNFLEANTDYSCCFHPAKVLKEGQIVDDFITEVDEDKLTFNQMLANNFIYTFSVVFQNNLKDMTPYLRNANIKIADIGIHLLNFKFGKLGYIKDVMGVYQIHHSNTWAQKDFEYKSVESIKLQILLLDAFDGERKRALLDSIHQGISNIHNHYRPYIRELEDLKSSRARRFLEAIRRLIRSIKG